jgi:predicted DNA-binding protein
MTSNITLRLDDKTLNRIRHLAVDRNTSVSAWVSDLVTRTVNELDEFALARERALAFMSDPVAITDATPLTREQAHER